MTTTNQPIETLRDGSIKATIWKNEGDNGSFYTAEISRTYQKEETYHDSYSFSGTDLLKVSRLTLKAYDRIAELLSVDKKGS
ncbi:MAG: hypothetical protein L3K26_00190 [Candidatus Hydrogenedentes bacterium]|nr:hypothetical protein [Candidatus Hydrogenedentota bacterium]